MATIDLDAIQVAKPCQVPWESMDGDDLVRFCGQCRLNVYDLSALSSDEARALIEKHEGRLCVRFYRRRDGKVLTRDCPVGVRTVRRRRVGFAAGIAAAAGFAGGLMQGLRGRPLPVASTRPPVIGVDEAELSHVRPDGPQDALVALEAPGQPVTAPQQVPPERDLELVQGGLRPTEEYLEIQGRVAATPPPADQPEGE